MPRPGEDRSDVGGAAQFNNIGPVPLSAAARLKIARTSAGPPSSTISDLSRFLLLLLCGTPVRFLYRTCPALLPPLLSPAFCSQNASPG